MLDDIKKISKGVSALLVLVVFVSSFSPFFATKAHAFIVFDPSNFAVNTDTAINTSISAGTDVAQATKEFGLDAIAFTIINLVIERIAASTINWINSGFRGSPAFVTDPEGYFKDMGDKIAGQYIFTNPNLNFLCGPIQAKVRLALTTNYIRDPMARWQCTLTDVVGNIDDFMGDFEKGGWNGFYELTQRQQNNPLGAYMQAENEMYAQISTRQGTKRAELDWGRGFMSFETCGPEGRDADGTCIGRADISTPGSVIESKLNSVLNTGDQRIAAADEINEILSALLEQLVSKALGGLGSLSRSGSSGSSFTDQLSTGAKNTKITDYFDTSQKAVDAVNALDPYEPPDCRNTPNLPECKPLPGSCDPVTDPVSCPAAP